MATIDQGTQKIGWKYSTPLQADYLNTFISGLHFPGLVTRPSFRTTSTTSGCDIEIGPFSVLIYPSDRIGSSTDENGKQIYQRLVKITMTNTITKSITRQTFALGLTYSFTHGGYTQSQWYADVIPLNTQQDIETFEGLIIATCQNVELPDHSIKYSVTTNGADISDALLMSEGWDPKKWLSLVHPKRSNTTETPTEYGKYNRLEVRSHNSLYSGYMAGVAGLVSQGDFTYSLPVDSEHPEWGDGTKGVMPNIYNAFKIQSNGFALSDSSHDLPIENPSGGIFALVTATNTVESTEFPYDTSFTNKLTINPVEQEDLNIYVIDNTLYIK